MSKNKIIHDVDSGCINIIASTKMCSGLQCIYFCCIYLLYYYLSFFLSRIQAVTAYRCILQQKYMMKIFYVLQHVYHYETNPPPLIEIVLIKLIQFCTIVHYRTIEKLINLNVGK